MIKFIPLLCSLFLMASCATYQGRIAAAKKELTAGDCENSLKSFEKLAADGGGDQLLYLLEEGSALQVCKDYQKSNQIFLQADQLSEQVDYQSLSRDLGATLLNEEMIQYKGDTFEKLFINASAALNYLELGQFDEAMVEVRRIDEKYNKFTAEEKNSYELNSFAQYLSGLVWEVSKNYDDACISYQAAYKLDMSFRDVGLDMLSACWRAKRYQEFDRLTKTVNPGEDELKYIKIKNKNEVIVIYLQGLGPQKTQRPDNRIYPKLVPTATSIKKLMAVFQDENGTEQSKMSQPIYSVEKSAIATLEADYSSLVARRLGARVAKEVVADQIRQKDKTLGNIAWLVMVASERADLRNWTLLPETVQVMRLNAAPGSKIKLTGLNGFQAEAEVLPEIDLSLSDKKKIYLVRTIK
jgi:uncharacterized protein